MATTGINRDVITALDTALKRAKEAAIREAQKQGRLVHRQYAKDFEREVYHNVTGRRRVRGYSTTWGFIKARLGLDPRRGHAGLGLEKVTRSPAGFVRHKHGFTMDYLIPARQTFTVTSRRSRIVKARRVMVAKYINHFAAKKAPGFGEMSKADTDRITRAAGKVLATRVAKVQQAAARTTAVGQKYVTHVRLQLKRLGIAA
jgi:hypothetical protein